jgi:hypothetical protein
MIGSQTACFARMLPFRSVRQTKGTATIRADQHPQPPFEALYGRICTQTAAVLLAGLALSSSAGPALAANASPAADTPTSSPNPFRAVAAFYKSRQQANGGAFFLGPIQLSKIRLENAVAALQSSEEMTVENYATAMESVRAASLDCIVLDFEGKQDLTTAPSSEQEYKFGDPCKLRLIVKNATTLTKDKKLVAETEAKMQSFINELQLLDDKLDRATQGDVEAGVLEKLLKEAINTNREFEEAIKRCLGLEA